MNQLAMFSDKVSAPYRPVAVCPEVSALLALDAPVAIGVSGGKDSCAVAFATVEYLNRIGHRGPRILIHADLGIVEWDDSLPVCERLAAVLGMELVVVRRAAGGLMERWQGRWANNVARYESLSCVKLILPWSTPSMRFCTSELKTAVICRYLIERFAGQQILSVNGIRREESSNRADAPISKIQNRLASVTWQTSGLDWQPLVEWTKEDVFARLDAEAFALHEAYRIWHTSRVSCRFCIMSSASDLVAAAACPASAPLYRIMVGLEIVSTFAFQGEKWLGDVAPHLLDAETRKCLQDAKERARRRERAESRIPEHLLYVKGWPIVVPTWDEAELLCEVRAEVADAVGLTVEHGTPDAIIARYEELIRLREGKEAKGRKKAVVVASKVRTKQSMIAGLG